jgi:hypothetical protein
LWVNNGIPAWASTSSLGISSGSGTTTINGISTSTFNFLAGTGLGVSTSSNEITYVNNGVLSFNGATGTISYSPLSLLSAVAPISYNSSTGAFSFVNPGYITLTGLSGTSPITYNTSTGAIGFSNPGYLLNTALSNGQIFIGSVGDLATAQTMTGDATLGNTGILTLATTSVTAASYTNTNLTVDSKGRITTASNGSGGLATTTINGVNGQAFTFATSSDTNIGFNISTSSGTLTFTPTWIGTLANARIASSTIWNTAYTDRLKWDGGATDLVAATGRTSLGLGTMSLLPNTGSSTITTVGTIASGIWNGSAIPVANGGTGLTSGYNNTNWDTSYTDRLKWDGGATGLTAATGRTSLGLTDTATLASTTFYLSTNPSSFISRTGLSATSPLFYSTSTGVFTIQQASSTANGYLSSTDWSTFNGKQNTISFPIAVASTSLTAGTNIVLSTNTISVTSTPSFTTINGMTVSSDADFNTKVGFNAGINLASGAQNNTFVGYEAGKLSSTSTNTVLFNVAIGKQALYSDNSGPYNTAIGGQSLFGNVTGGSNTALGYLSLSSNSTGSRNIGIGYLAGKYETGSDAFYVDNRDRTNTAGDKAGAILYGTMSSTPANQTLKVNASLTVLATTTLSNITGSTQCLHVDTNGVITGAGSDCASTAGFLAAANNLSDLASSSTARTNLGLGDSSMLASSTWFKVANNLSEGTASTMRTNLGLGTMALEANTGTTTITTLGTIGTGTWSGTTIAINKGGTGITTAPTTNGQLLMSSSTGWVVGNLVAGTNITLTTSTAGQVTINAPKQCNYFTIESPTASEDDTFMIFDTTSTLTRVMAVNKSTGDTATFNLIWDQSRATASSSAQHAFAADWAVTATTTATSTATFASSTIPSNSIMRFITSAASSTQFNVNICYTTP